MTVKDLIDQLMKLPMTTKVEIAYSNEDHFHMRTELEDRPAVAVRVDARKDPHTVLICDATRTER